MFSEYQLGLLYGDGFLENKGTYQFTTTNIHLANNISETLEKNKAHFYHYQRENKEEKENWGTLEIVTIRDKKAINEIKRKGLLSSNAKERIHFNKDFLRGYLETKGGFAQFESRGIESWRVYFSGNLEDLSEIREYLYRELGVNKKQIVHRKEREELGIKSKSYRLPINRRQDIEKIVLYLISDKEISPYLRSRMEDFLKYKRTELFNIKRIFKHYKYAAKSMAKILNYELKGVRGSSGKGVFPVYKIIDEYPVEMYNGWEEAYEKIRKEFKETTGIEPPKVK